MEMIIILKDKESDDLFAFKTKKALHQFMDKNAIEFVAFKHYETGKMITSEYYANTKDTNDDKYNIEYNIILREVE